MAKKLFTGVATALPTFFKNGQRINYEETVRHVYNLYEKGIKTFVLFGSTGEAESLSEYEKHKLFDNIKSTVTDAKYVLGVGKAFTKQTVKECVKISKWGADGLLCLSPFLNKSNQDGIIRHFQEIDSSECLPFIIYNVPKRTGIEVYPKTIAILKHFNKVYGIKEAGGNENTVTDYISAVNNDIGVYSGDDTLNGKFLRGGADGVISVVANVFPEQLIKQYDYYSTGQTESGDEIQRQLNVFNECLTACPNPIPLKYALKLKGYGDGTCRLPLTFPSEVVKQRIEYLYKKSLGVLK